jgi:hypothetical protein
MLPSTLVAPLLASLGAILGTLDGDVGRLFPAANRGWSKSCHLYTGGMMGDDATSLFSGALWGIGQRVEGSQKCSAMCATSGRPCQRPPVVVARPPLSTRLIIVWVPCALFRPRAYLTVLPTCQGLTLWAWLSPRNLGENGSAVVELSWSRMASRRAPAGRSWPELGYEMGRSSAPRRTVLTAQHQWHESLSAGGRVCPPHWRWVEVKKPWPWPLWHWPNPLDWGGGAALLQIELRWWRSPSSRSFPRPEAQVVVVRLGRLPSPHVHRLARSIIVRPQDKCAIARGVGCHPTTMSPVVVEWLS